MGCLNAGQGFSHWFGNIHLSGPCNRSCYFCIGQHMMALDPLNNLDEWPLRNIDEFVERCLEHGVTEVNLTGTNTDPLLYRHTRKLKLHLRERLGAEFTFGIRTNGALIDGRGLVNWSCYDKGSITVCSFDPDTYKAMMGRGAPPNLRNVRFHTRPQIFSRLKVNVVLGPENTGRNVMDFLGTLRVCQENGITRVNLREPYGQPRIGDPLADVMLPSGTVLGMPQYVCEGLDGGPRMSIVYWDVHYVEVESVNLYANGEVSVMYPITKGHCPTTGKIQPQSEFEAAGRHRPQWQYRHPKVA